jgi:hypothetical protein
MLTYAHVRSRMQAEDRAYRISPPRPQREAQEQREKARAQVLQVSQVARDAGTWPQEGGGGHALAGGAVQVEERAELQEYIYTRGGAMSRYGGGGVAVVQRQQRARGVLAFRAGQ